MAKMKKSVYETELYKLQIELVKLQEWVKATDQKVVVLFEGRDAAGKGGVIKAMTQRLNPRVCRIAALGVPTEKEKSQWYFQRYAAHLPSAGEVVLFDRSWYNRAGVEHVMGFCSEQEYWEFLRACPDFERMLINSGIILIKYWFSVSHEEQLKRFEERVNNPIKRWKFSEMDFKSRGMWKEYSEAKDRMLSHTSTDFSPWYVVDADDKKKARLNCISHLLDKIPYQTINHPEIEMEQVKIEEAVRPPITTVNYIDGKY
jgi:polyphosphate kinase 2